MSIPTPQLPHPDLVRYLTGNADESLRQNIAQLRGEYPELEMLLELAEKTAPARPDAAPPAAQLTFAQIDRLLQDLYAGNADPARQTLFRTHLLTSPQFYRRLLDHFADMRQTAAEADALQASGAMIGSKTNREILRELGIETARAAAPRRTERPGEGFLGTVQAFFASQFARYAIPALASLAVLFMVGLPIYSDMTNPYKQLRYDEQAPPAQFDPERWVQSSAPATRNGAVAGSDSLNLSSFRAGSERLAGVMQLMLPAFRERDYRNVLDKYRRTYPGAEALASWLQTHGNAPAAGDSVLQREIAGTQQLLQDYYFLSGAASLARYRTRSETLDPAARDSALAAAVSHLTRARTLGEEYRLPDPDRIHYFLGLALAYQFRNAEAIREYRQIGPESAYYRQAQELMEYLQ